MCEPAQQAAPADGGKLYLFVQQVGLPDGGTPEELQWQLRAIANTHIPRPTEAPTLEAPISTEEGYQLDVATPGPCMGVMVRIHPDSIELAYLSQTAEEPPEELFVTTLADAARQVLIAKGWDDSPIVATVSETWTFAQLKAVDPYNALVHLVDICEEVVAPLGGSMAESLEHGKIEAVEGGEDDPLPVTFGNSWVRMPITDSLFTAATLYFYPGCFQVVGEAHPDTEEPSDEEAVLELYLCAQELALAYLDKVYPELADAAENAIAFH
jgi:hypothetical protein